MKHLLEYTIIDIFNKIYNNSSFTQGHRNQSVFGPNLIFNTIYGIVQFGT